MSGRHAIFACLEETLSWTKDRARVAALSRSRNPDDPDLIDARRNLKAARLEDYVNKVVAEAPELSNEQLDKIAGLLRAGGGAA